MKFRYIFLLLICLITLLVVWFEWYIPNQTLKQFCQNNEYDGYYYSKWDSYCYKDRTITNESEQLVTSFFEKRATTEVDGKWYWYQEIRINGVDKNE